MKRFLTYIIMILLQFSAAMAQADYYKSIDGMKGGETLKTALHRLIKNHQRISYGKGSSSTWAAFYTTDATEESGKRRVLDMYSNEVRYFGNKGDAIDGMNIEHSVAKSWWGGAENNAYCDLHHLNPSDQTANSRKSNYPLGELTSVSWDNGVTFVGKANIDGSSQNAYEPCDDYKGDFARTFMYMFTCYQDLTWKYTWMNYESNAYPTLKPWAVELLLKWHKQDPVSEKEVNRNNAVKAVQGNRNPFVDYPQLADYIWGDSINYTFHLDGRVESSGDTGGDDDDNGNISGEGNSDNFTNGSFELVTDVAQLKVGDSIVIVYENFVMGASAGNYRKKTDVMTSNGKVTYLADDAQKILLEEGAVYGTFAFNVGNGYLTASSSSKNYLITSETFDANGSWFITIGSDALVVIKAQGDKTHNTLQYNTSSPRFSCYKGTQESVNIYAKSPVATGIGITEIEESTVNVYSLTGVLLRKNVARDTATDSLQPGIYIVGKKRVIVK